MADVYGFDERTATWLTRVAGERTQRPDSFERLITEQPNDRVFGDAADVIEVYRGSGSPTPSTATHIGNWNGVSVPSSPLFTLSGTNNEFLTATKSLLATFTLSWSVSVTGNFQDLNAWTSFTVNLPPDPARYLTQTTGGQQAFRHHMTTKGFSTSSQNTVLDFTWAGAMKLITNDVFSFEWEGGFGGTIWNNPGSAILTFAGGSA